jgi:hypothetical protein
VHRLSSCWSSPRHVGSFLGAMVRRSYPQPDRDGPLDPPKPQPNRAET